MPKPRKMLTDCDAHIVSLMRLIETQSKVTIANWCVSYADAHLLPVWEKTFPDDDRPRAALQAARDWLEGRIKLRGNRIELGEIETAAKSLPGIDRLAKYRGARLVSLEEEPQSLKDLKQIVCPVTPIMQMESPGSTRLNAA